jgi:hypothetical protein
MCLKEAIGQGHCAQQQVETREQSIFVKRMGRSEMGKTAN